MPYPTAKTLQTLGIDHDTAVRVRSILDGTTDPLTVAAAEHYNRSCFNDPPNWLLKLYAIDALIGTHGVEHVAKGHNAKSPAFDYLNTGDTYAVTLIRFNGGQYRVGCWGDIVERGHYD